MLGVGLLVRAAPMTAWRLLTMLSWGTVRRHLRRNRATPREAPLPKIGAPAEYECAATIDNVVTLPFKV
ncbi:hypothetical protein PF005_g32436 [Phytophthora fragariae]|uniref:Uncharacterized protein n=1 Tax=Phytophthora fragariae TaxID=53985 RepID=A0A6A3PIL0_9STRA|nr:hypothetical protein PF003_g18388 [Phytophthora fragariae]KAE8897434.1 hypothetical protein PF003_g18384 [Phytophthora fragariae]KAE8902591.1 hypothetical protein PF003_g13585 [Phytophthora fragariae]KAE8902597.1 hypothetical protein PF003_g13589 [Phytophthora fragariae]KAE8907178.1 hypothetical protein PF003_g8954 [Phytophthora fragariae]